MYAVGRWLAVYLIYMRCRKVVPVSGASIFPCLYALSHFQQREVRILELTMPSEEKFQAGEAYGDVEKDSANFFSDPAKIAQDLLKDCAGLANQTTLPELVGLIKELLQKGQPLDDKKG